jgi:transposase
VSALYASIAARDEVAGGSAIDPKSLLALWAYATSDGDGSARKIGRLTEVHAAYRWLCGGVDVGYPTVRALPVDRAAASEAMCSTS